MFPAEYWAESSNGTMIVMLNIGSLQEKTVVFADVPGLKLWSGENLGRVNDEFTIAVESYNVTIILAHLAE
jgi:hypothetical protein